MSFAEAMDKAATQYLQEVLAQSDGNMTAAAKIARLHRRQLYRLCERFKVTYVRGRPHSQPPLAPWRTPYNHVTHG